MDGDALQLRQPYEHTSWGGDFSVRPPSWRITFSSRCSPSSFPRPRCGQPALPMPLDRMMVLA